MLRNLILSAAAAGLAAGLLTAGLQHATTTPLILRAEQYEGASTRHPDSGIAEGVLPGTPDAAAQGAAWTPADGGPRITYTSIATVLIGVGFALALLGAMILSGIRIAGPSGLAFGVAGFAAFALAPALGLPPEIPGSAAADLIGRQLWWLSTAGATSLGLAALLLTRVPLLQAGGVALIAIPHLVGAPQPAAFASAAPAELAGHFAAASLVVTAVFWAVLGFASGTVYERLARAG